MMKKSLIALSLLGAFAVPAFAEETPVHSVTANVGVVTDYVFRGISQSQHQAAFQGGVDYAHNSGLYAGVWGSTIEWVNRKDYSYQKDNKFETDLYGGYKNTIGDVGYDVGLIRYYYKGKFDPNSVGGVTANTTEAYIGLTYGIASLKYNRALTSFIGWGNTDADTKSKGSDYIDLTVTYPIDETTNVIGHFGRQNVKNDNATGYDASYNDWKLGVTKDFGFGVVGLTYTDTSANNAINGYKWADKDVSRGVLAASFLKNF